MSKFRRLVRRVLVGCAIALLASVVSPLIERAQAAQGQPQMPGMPGMPANVGNVLGTVTKASGGAVAGATVIATNTTNNSQYSASTGDDGQYSLPSMPVGTYDVSVLLGGFKPFKRAAVVVGTNTAIQVDAALEPGDTETERQALLDRIEQLEKRLSDVESTTVLSEPETRVKRIEVYVDPSGGVHDVPTPGATREVTYQRERVYRRQTINEKIEQALAAAEDQSVRIGIDATSVTQGAGRTMGDRTRPDKKAYALASADLFFVAKLAQYTTFFANVVALSGSPPDREIPSLTLLNGYTARLVNQNELNLREAWLRTEFFGQRVALTAGRLDLTNYFDRNVGANDETTQFLSDALVNNQMLGLAVNGTGIVAVYDPKNPLTFRFGVQQNNPNATSLSDSIYSLAEVGYTATPFSLPEGHYRFWFRANNGSINSQGVIGTLDSKRAFGVSLDQKLNPFVTLFGRYGAQQLPGDRDQYASAGLSIGRGLVFNPLDTWGIGYAQLDRASGDTERLTEGYYNLQMTQRLRLTFTLQRVLDSPADNSKFGYLLPGLRLQAAF